MPRINDHPTLRTLLEIADIYSLTLEGAHRLFGYDLGEMRKCDFLLNSRRTHIFESYPFQRDLLVDLPLQLAPRDSFSADAFLRDLVLEWQTDIPIRALDDEGWEQPGAFYVHIGTEDSAGSSIPPGAMAKVEPISDAERALPNPRSIYLLQFGDGYRCSHCVVAQGKLRPFSSGRRYFGREAFTYPGSVRIAGRIRMFAMRLPCPEYPVTVPLTAHLRGGDLLLPWEHRTRDHLLLTKHRRFIRTEEEELRVQEFLKELLHSNLSGRSQRRYRRPTSSEPHVNSLMHLALAHVARYTDTLRTGGSWQSDEGRFSLETLLQARSIEESFCLQQSAVVPRPGDVWEARRREFGGWPPLLSERFPNLRQYQDRVVRLAEPCRIAGLDPELGAGSLLLLEECPARPDPGSDVTRLGWARPIYVLRRGLDIACGYLERNGSQYALLSGAYGEVTTTFRAKDHAELSRVCGVAVPL